MFNGANNTHIPHGTFVDVSGTSGLRFNINNVTADPLKGLYDLLHPVQASYKDRSGKLARCLEGTREKVLHEIKTWVDGTLPICWLNGPAGFGKSTIAQTVAEWCADEGRLAASFFFFRGMGNRDKISHLISTLAFQLSTTIENIEPLIKDALTKEPFLSQRGIRLGYQFDKLIMDPMLSHVQSTSTQNDAVQKRMVIVIDALDECEVGDGESMDEFIDAVIDACRSKGGRVPFRLFITSRVEEHLRLRLETIDAKEVSLQLKLQQYNASKDIRMFFQSEFANIYAANRLLMVADGVPEPWPSWDVLDTLVDKAAGSYIYASTFVNFVQEARGMAHRQLIDALKAHGLDPLYMQVFSKASSAEVVSGSMVNLKQVMGILLHLTSPLSIRDLALLIDVPLRDLLRAFFGIQSILIIPESNNSPVHLVHTSLRDFLTTRSRSGGYFNNPPDCHASIAIRCMNIMQRNGGLFWFIDGPVGYAFKYCLDHLQQAVHGWKNYHSESPLFISLSNSLTDFTGSVLDPWVHTAIRSGAPEMLSGLAKSSEDWSQCPKKLRSALNSLNSMIEHIEVRNY
ncbi:hypothetical protein SERLA73DRAFT_181948 [Serpula lacrymans var. lacrymans S7.3]|uniref:Nephrocystin 3-like N-terminal domain-containing protein n=2 Tax=Serpula lacrymans var. lacrymans TaxID=341189 RepID=F8PZ20_SERL3|nr:uncharacterized protein SERLADRAFT_468372 [Serpula lacrymans var. lacrymans S7.9]EGN99133.1 hypothetical protein SERLA73DRAFT_181948 [Serpula lacrymans var. lacrymans S7.3]EGO24700.1 hypothetical protein SERLADRAFT_468372 [Serpula lacrymans var. lacrymans S7.9]